MQFLCSDRELVKVLRDAKEGRPQAMGGSSLSDPVPFITLSPSGSSLAPSLPPWCAAKGCQKFENRLTSFVAHQCREQVFVIVNAKRLGAHGFDSLANFLFWIPNLLKQAFLSLCYLQWYL